MFSSQVRTHLAVLLLTMITVLLSTEACDLHQVVRGCKIQQGRCFCGVGCPADFRYANRDDCKAALKGKGKDACTDSPCKNGGACIQTGTNYKCRCEGTGYYGTRCQFACPSPSAPSLKSYPYECIEI